MKTKQKRNTAKKKKENLTIVRVKALKNIEHAGVIILHRNRKYKVKKYLDRFFYPPKAINKYLIPKGGVEEIK